MNIRFIFLLLILISFCHAFDRPWQNQSWLVKNPGIWTYGIEVWWNLPEFEISREKMQLNSLGNLEISDSQIKSNLRNASISSDLAQRSYFECTQLLNLSSWIGISPIPEFVNIFARVPACFDYKDRWKTAVDKSFLALEGSTKQTDIAIQKFKLIKQTLEDQELCAIDYSGIGKSECIDGQRTAEALDKKTQGSIYYLYYLYSDNLSKGTFKYQPDFSLYSSLMKIIWSKDGIISTLDSKSEKLNSTFELAKSSFFKNISETNLLKVETDILLKDLNDENINKIITAPYTDNLQKIGTINERFDSIKNKEKLLLAKLTTLKEIKTFDNKKANKPTLKFALTSISEVNSDYSKIIQELKQLKTDASLTETQQKEESEKELAETAKIIGKMGEDANRVYKDAQDAYKNAENEKTIGDKFAMYYRAASLARFARSEKSFENQSNNAIALAEFEKLIKNAEKDQINVESEKEVLNLLKSVPFLDIISTTKEWSQNIIQKAKNKYEPDIPDSHKRILNKLNLAGDEALDLYTDLSNYEKGIYVNESISYPSAIGSLKTLNENYATLESTLDQYMKEIVGNGMSITTKPIISPVRFDQPSTISLDLLFTNPQEYNATSVLAKANVGYESDFLYSDIKIGKENIDSIRTQGNNLVFIFKKVEPFKAYRVVLEKQKIIARTTKRTSSAIGIGYDSAKINEKIDFELDMDVNNLDFDPNALIDGVKKTYISKGKHSLTSERIDVDAYEQIISDVHSYQIGLNSKVEYKIGINPKIDLVSIPIYVSIPNSSQISSFDMSSGTGEALTEKQRVSSTQYYGKLSGLTKGKQASVLVSYMVSDTKTYVEKEITKIDNLPKSKETKVIIEKAKEQAAKGDYNKALELVEQSKTNMANEEKEAQKSAKKLDELKAKALEQIKQMNITTNSTDPFFIKVNAKKEELEKILQGPDSDAKLTALSNFDYSWLGGEISSLQKSLQKQYNDMKKEYFDLGYTNTPSEFLDFENEYAKLDASLSTEDAKKATEALELVKNILKEAKEKKKFEFSSLKEIFDKTKGDVEKILTQYLKESNLAKGTELASYFSETQKSIEKKISDADPTKIDDPRIFWLRFADLNKTSKKLSDTLDSLKSESSAKLNYLSDLLSRSNLDESKKAQLKDRLKAIAQMIDAGEFVNALRASSALSKEFDKTPQASNQNLLLISIGSIIALAAIVFVIMKQKKPQEPQKLRKL